MAREYANWECRALQTVMPDLERFMDSQEFLVMRIIVPFSRAERLRVESNGVEFSIGCADRMYGSNGIV